MNRTVPMILPCRGLRYGVLVFFVLLTMLFCSIGAAARTEETSFGNAEMYAQVNAKNTEEIQIYFLPDEAFLSEKQGETLYLFTLQPHETAENLRMKSPTATKVVEKSTKFTVSSDASGERLRAKYVLALGEGADYRVIGEAYVTNPEVLSDNTVIRTEASTIKGLVVSGALAADAQSLGIGHAVIPIVADRYITAVGGDPRYSRATAGLSTNFDPTMIAQLDALVASLQQNGTRILFRFLLDGSDRGTTEPAAALYAESVEAGASSYGFSLKTKEAYQTVNNLFTYFAERYAADSETPIDFIIGYQVNEWVGWYDLGYTSEQMDAAVEEYAAVFRLADLALRSHSANSRVYLPLSNLWATGRPFLSAFAREMGADAAWSVAVAPYASQALDDSIWDDTGAKNNRYSTYLTMNNIGILKEFLEEAPYLYQKTRRAVIVDDFAVHGTSGDEASQERQAASFAYAYYMAAQADFLDALIWHRMIDGAGEQCSLGLRQLDAVEKPIYTLFRVIDTQLGSDAAEPYAKIIGERKWSSIIKGFSKKIAETSKRYESSGVTVGEDAAEAIAGASVLLAFTDRTLHGFTPSDYMASVEVQSVTGGTEINTAILTAVSHPMASSDIASVTANVSDVQLSPSSEVLYLTLKVDAEAAVLPGTDGELTAIPAIPDSVRVRLQLSCDGNAFVFYLGEADMPIGAWQTLAFDIKSYAREAGGVDLLRLSLIGTGDADMIYTLSVNDVRAETGAGLVVLRVFLVILAILGAAVLLFIGLVIRAQIIRRRRRRQRAAQRAAYLARQRQLQKERMQAQMQQTGVQAPVQPQQGTAAHTQQARRGAQRRPDMYGNPRRDYDDSPTNRR